MDGVTKGEDDTTEPLLFFTLDQFNSEESEPWKM